MLPSARVIPTPLIIMEVPVVSTKFELAIELVRLIDDKLEELETGLAPLESLMARRKLLVSLEAPKEIDPPLELTRSTLSVAELYEAMILPPVAELIALATSSNVSVVDTVTENPWTVKVPPVMVLPTGRLDKGVVVGSIGFAMPPAPVSFAAVAFWTNSNS